MSIELEKKIGKIVERNYTDFGPTLASEKLFELDGIKISKEKARRIMIAKGLWKVRRKRERCSSVEGEDTFEHIHAPIPFCPGNADTAWAAAKGNLSLT